MPSNKRRKKKRKFNTGAVSVGSVSSRRTPTYDFAPDTPSSGNPFASVFNGAKKKGVFGKQPFRTDLSMIDIRTKAWQASNDNPFAYEELQKENRRLARLANSRLRALEKAGLDMFAYDRAITYLANEGRNRFSAVLAPQSDYKAMVRQLSELVTFVNSKTSTVAEARKSLQKKLDKISEYTGTEYTAEQGYQLGRLLGNDSISTLLRDVKADSDEVLEILEELSMEDFNKERLTTTVDRYLQGYQPWDDNSDYLNYDELMDELRSYRDELRSNRLK